MGRRYLANKVPIGSEVFVTEWLKIKGERIRSNLLEIGNLLDPTGTE